MQSMKNFKKNILGPKTYYFVKYVELNLSYCPSLNNDNLPKAAVITTTTLGTPRICGPCWKKSFRSSFMFSKLKLGLQNDSRYRQMVVIQR